MTAPGVLARLRTPRPAEVVAVSVSGHPAAVAAIARALDSVAVVTGMSHHVVDGPVIRLDVTCHPARPVAVGRVVGR